MESEAEPHAHWAGFLSEDDNESQQQGVSKQYKRAEPYKCPANDLLQRFICGPRIGGCGYSFHMRISCFDFFVGWIGTVGAVAARPECRLYETGNIPGTQCTHLAYFHNETTLARVLDSEKYHVSFLLITCGYG